MSSIVLHLTTDKTKATRFSSSDAAVKYGSNSIVTNGGLAKIVKVDGSFGEISTKPEFSLEITGIVSTFNGVKSTVTLEVPHYPMTKKMAEASSDEKVEGDVAQAA